MIEIVDDGRGLDTARIKAKALEAGLISESEISAKSQAEINNLIFAPGFSTALEVTSISGRGVGMDIVRSNIEQIGGTVETPDCDQWRPIERISTSKNPGREAGVSKYQGRLQAGIFASSSDGSRST